MLHYLNIKAEQKAQYYEFFCHIKKYLTDNQLYHQIVNVEENAIRDHFQPYWTNLSIDEFLRSISCDIFLKSHTIPLQALQMLITRR